MKKFIVLLIMIMLTASVFGASAFDIKWWSQETYSNLPGNTLRAWAEDVEGGAIGTGSKFYVDSGVASGGDSSGSSWTNAITTIDAAVGKCTASRGDIIYVAPGHADAVISATGLVCDIAGVSIIGIGNGSLIPTITLGTATTAKISVTAANVRLSHLKITSALANVAEGIDPTADADGLVVDNCIFTDGAVALELVIGINVTADCDNIRLINNRFSTVPAGGCTNAIVLAGGSDNSVISGNVIYGTYTAGGILASGAASINLTITDNIVGAIDAIAYAGNAGTTGLLARNLLGANTTSIAAALTGYDAMFCLENYVTGLLAKSGIIFPAVDSD